MNWFKDTLEILTRGKGLYPFTDLVQNCIRQWGIHEGMCFLYVPHTSALWSAKITIQPPGIVNRSWNG
jgi:thiamine phosphate synthase YjbQ (UPF0047 family)